MCNVLKQQNHCGSKQRKAQEIARELFVTSCYSTILFQSIEKTLDNMAFFVLIEVAFPGINRVRFRWDAIRSALRFNIGTDLDGSVSLVAHHDSAFEFDTFEGVYRGSVVVYISGR